MELTSPLAGKGDAEQEEGGGKRVAKQLVALQLLLQPSLRCLFPALIKKQESKSLSYPKGDVTRDALLVATALGFIQHTSHWTSPKASYSKAFLYKQLIRETRKLWEKKTAAGIVLWPLCRISGCSTVKYYSAFFCWASLCSNTASRCRHLLSHTEDSRAQHILFLCDLLHPLLLAGTRESAEMHRASLGPPCKNGGKRSSCSPA